VRILGADNFRRDAYGHVTSQCGHICIGLAAYILLGVWGWTAALLIGLVYVIGWEFWWQGGGLFWDSIEDAAFVTAGALFLPVVAVGQGPGMVITVGLWLAFGAWLRR